MHALLLAALIAGADPAPPTPEMVERGKKVYAENRCALCHSVAGKGNAKGPHDDVGSKYQPEDLRRWVMEPAEMAKRIGATRKPPMIPYSELAKEDLDALVAYLSTLKKKP